MPDAAVSRKKVGVDGALGAEDEEGLRFPFPDDTRQDRVNRETEGEENRQSADIFHREARSIPLETQLCVCTGGW